MAGQQIFPEWKTILGTEFRCLLGPARSVVKRSGEVHRYDRAKIEAAVAKAFDAVGALPAGVTAEAPEVLKKVVDLVEQKLRNLMSGRHPNSIPAIEEIQDLVELALVEAGEAKVAKAYILYRAKHEAMRDAARLMLDINSTMDGYLSQSRLACQRECQCQLLARRPHPSQLRHDHRKLLAQEHYPEEIAAAHKDADFHIHDLSMFSGLLRGLVAASAHRRGPGRHSRQDRLQARLAPLHPRAANGEFSRRVQNESAGAQALSSFDTYLAPFVRKDAMSEADVRQCMQSFLFGVNTPSRWGSQAPFTNVTLDWTCPADLRDKEAVVGGKGAGFAYGDCQAEMDTVNKVFIELMLEGDAMGRGFQYPIPTYNVTKDFDWDSENARLLFEMTAKYGTPYFQNFISSDLDPGDVRSMCCRLQLDKRELRKRGGGLFGSDELTGSVGVVTINLPRIGYLSKNRKELYSRLDGLMDLAARSLEIKRKVVSRLLEGGLFPYTRRYLGSFDNHFNTIGLVGMHDCCMNFLGVGIETREGRAFSLEVLAHMRERLQEYQVSTGQLFNLEATPAESTSYRLAKHDKEKWPDIVTSAPADGEPYYTNSSQLPVGFGSDIFDALDHQEELQASYTGGTVFHVFLGEAPDDWRAVRDLVESIASQYRVPYYTYRRPSRSARFTAICRASISLARAARPKRKSGSGARSEV